MTKYRVITDFSKKTVDGLISFSNNIYVRMVGHTKLNNPPSPLSTLRTLIDNLIASNGKKGDLTKQGTAIKVAARAALEAYLKTLALYVQENSDNDPAIMLSSGFDLVKQKSPVGPLPMPTDLSADCIKGIPGSVKLMVEPVEKSDGYIWKYTESPVVEASIWQLEFCKPANITLALKPRTEYVFCVAAMGTDPTRTFSEKLTFFVV